MIETENPDSKKEMEGTVETVRKVFMTGKVRDFDPNNPQPFIDDVKADLNTMTGRDIPLNMIFGDYGMLVLNIPVVVNYDVEEEQIPEVIARLIMGDDVPYPVPHVPTFGQQWRVEVSRDQIEDFYKKNAKILNASTFTDARIPYINKKGISLILEYM